MSGQTKLTSRNLNIIQFNQLINSKSPLNDLYTRAKDICSLNEKLKNYLASSLSNHCIVANYSAESLTINAESSAWATKLRYRIPDILDFAKNECGLSELTSVRIKVSPHQNNSAQAELLNTRPARKASLSRKSAEFIKNVAASVQDNALRESILKISKNAK